MVLVLIAAFVAGVSVTSFIDEFTASAVPKRNEPFTQLLTYNQDSGDLKLIATSTGDFLVNVCASNNIHPTDTISLLIVGESSTENPTYHSQIGSDGTCTELGVNAGKQLVIRVTQTEGSSLAAVTLLTGPSETASLDLAI